MLTKLKELEIRFPLANPKVLKIAIDLSHLKYKYCILEELKKQKLVVDKATDIAINYFLFYEISIPEYLSNEDITLEEKLCKSIFNKLSDEQKWHYASKGILSCQSIAWNYINNHQYKIEDNNDFVNMTLDELLTRGLILNLEKAHAEELAGEGL